MSKKIKSLIIASIALTGLHAQTDSTNSVLDEVVITATKTPQKQSTTGKVVTVISKAEIEQNQGKTLGQLLNQQVGMVVNGALGTQGSVQRVYTRGAGSGQTLILVDGIPAYDPSDIDNNFDLNFIPLANVERIEICKGAQSTLYGSDAIGGVINIITNKANIGKSINATVSVAGGSFGTIKTTAQVFGKINKFSYDAGYTGIRTDGFSSAYDSTGKSKFDNDGYKGNSFNASLKYQLNSCISLKAFGRISGYKADIDGGSFQDDSNRINNKTKVGGISFSVKKDKIQENGYYQYTTSSRHYDLLPGGTNDYHSITQVAEYYASFKLLNHLYMLCGGEYRYSSMNSLYHDPTYGDSPFSDTAFRQYSVYSSVIYKSDKLNIELGGRFNNHSRYGNNYTYTFNPSYKINNSVRLFGSIATAFKAPSLYQLFDIYSGNKNLQPEKSINYEVGAQHSIGILLHRLVLFYRDTKDGIDYNYGTYAYFNYNSQKVKGLEYEASVKATDDLTITANYTYLSPEESKLSSLTSKDTSYNYSLKIPAHTFNLSAGFNLNSHLYYRLSTKYVSTCYDFGGYQLSQYMLVNAYLEYKFNKNIKLYADLQNIGNVQFFETKGYNSIPRYFMGGISINL